jgi:hypothetical protein
MRLLLAFFGGYMFVVGGMLLLTPAMGRRLTDLWMKDKIHRPLAVLPLAIGGVLLWAAPASQAPLYIQVLGGLSLLKGVYLFVAPKAQLAGIVRWWQRMAPAGLRLWGLVTLFMGGAVLWTL